jgi:hypothetical protein
MEVKIIELGELKNPVIDFSGIKNAKLKGTYFGPRMIWKNASDTRVDGSEAMIRMKSHTHEEIVGVEGDVSGLVIQNLTLEDGGITFWGLVEHLDILNSTFFHGHTGIKISTSKPHQNIKITGCFIAGMSHEGFYIGPSYQQLGTALKDVRISRNRILACGWDNQVGNCFNAMIWENQFQHNGLKGTWGQKYQLTINPGTQAWVWDNCFEGPKYFDMQVLKSDVFPHDHIPQ